MEQDLSIAYQKAVIQSLSRLDPEIGEVLGRALLYFSASQQYCFATIML